MYISIYIIYTYRDHEMNRTFASVTSSAMVGNTSRCAQRGGTLTANVPPMGCDRALGFTINPIIRPDRWLTLGNVTIIRKLCMILINMYDTYKYV